MPSWGRRLVGIEGLRGVAALTVVTYHVIHVLTPGAEQAGLGFAAYLNEGLTLFFVLSGFLLFRPFALAVVRGTVRPQIRSYFLNRALRVWPAYVVVFLIVNYALQASRLPGPATGAVDIGVLPPGLTALNVVLLQNFTPAIRTGLEVAWTLGAEIGFYLVLPLLYELAVRVRRIANPYIAALSAPVLLLLVGGTTKAALHLATAGMGPAEAYSAVWGSNATSIVARSLLGQADLFAFGMLALLAYLWMRDARLNARTLRRLRLAAWLVAGAAIVGVTRAGGAADEFAAIAAALLLLIAVSPNARGSESMLGRILDLPPLRYIGLISFSLYLWHLPVIRWLAEHRLTPGSAGPDLLVVVVLSLLLSSVTYYGVEKTALRFKRRGASRTPSGAPARASSSQGRR